MKGLTPEFVELTRQKLTALKPSTPPKWGKLKAEELTSHLIAAIRSSTGEIPGPAFMGNWFTTTILPRIVYTGKILPPRNLPTRTPEGETIGAILAPGDMDTLADVMTGFMKGVEAGTLKTSIHPLFGDIGPVGWSKVHVVHFRHHFKQFGL